MSIALAYLRFSSLQMQGKGSSISRQKDMVTKWTEEQKLLTGKNYDEVSYYIDRGKSAYDGTNLREGNLGKLIEEVQRGMFPEGTPIVCESLDRLTRQGVQHIQQILTQLTRTGCVVHTLSDRQVISKDTLESLGGIVTIVAVADRAREESETKAKRVRDSKLRNYKAAREGKKLMTKHFPGWIYLNESTGKLCVDPEKQKVVTRIYKLRLEGHTFQSIANIMNDSGVPVLNASKGAKHWLPNSIRTLLMNKSVIGYSSPSKVNPLIEEIPGYFPPCISETLFNDVQDTHVPAKRGKKTRPEYAEAVNLFKGLTVCKYCKGNVFPNGAKPGYWGRLRCMGHHNKTCEAPPIGRYAFEHSLVTRMFPLLKFFDTTKQEDPSAAIRSKIGHLQTGIDNLYNMVRDMGYTPEIGKRIKASENEKEGLERQLIAIKKNIDSSTEENMSQLNFDNYNDRLTMQRILSRTIERVVVDSFNERAHIKLLNGNVLYGFPLYGDSDASLTLQKALSGTDDELFAELGMEKPLHTIYMVTGAKSQQPYDYDAVYYNKDLKQSYTVTEGESPHHPDDSKYWPDVEPDYPNE